MTGYGAQGSVQYAAANHEKTITDWHVATMSTVSGISYLDQKNISPANHSFNQYIKKTNRHLRCPVHGDALQSQEEQTVGQTNR